MAKTVTTIPATLHRFTATPINAQTKRKVAGYARVSTDNEDQKTSYAAQLDYYEKYIKSRPDWEFVSVYADEGLSATSTKHRVSFNRMIEDALAGKIDLIITKSVSRFARNTVDSLSTIRKLKDVGCECYFEKENIWTFDSKGEILISIMSSLAQEESRSISENCTWGWRKRCADGKVTVPFGRFLGYDRGEDGNLVINEEQAKIVRRIYGLFLQGYSPYKIAKTLTEEGIPTPGGKEKWGGAVIRSILGNEKYRGDARLQKVYTTDFLTKKKKKNDGEVPQYYVEGNHEAIVPPEIYEKAQVLLQARRKGTSRISSSGIFSSKIKCGDCGSWYGSKVWHSTDKYRRVIWQCNHKFDGGKKCGTPHFDEEKIKEMFVKAQNKLVKDKAAIIADFEEIKDTAFSTDDLMAEVGRLQGEMNAVTELLQKCIDTNARVAQDQKEYAKRYDTLVERFDKAKAQLDEVQATIAQKQARRQMMEHFVEELKKLPELVTTFDEAAWYGMVEFMTIYNKDDARVTFKNGMEVKI